MAIIHTIREKIKKQEYEFAIPHFFEEMANDDLTFADIEMAIANGKISRKFTKDPRGTRYEVVGQQKIIEKSLSFVGLKALENYC